MFKISQHFIILVYRTIIQYISTADRHLPLSVRSLCLWQRRYGKLSRFGWSVILAY